jgi:hypothetical protein
MENPQDPRRTITPDAFSVAPGLLGIPLANPWRRLAAMLIDLALIGLLANARAVFFALAAAAFLFWMAIRGRKDSRSGAARMGLGCLASSFAFIAVLVIWGPLFVPDDAVLFEAEGPGGAPVPVSVGAIGDLLSLVTESDTADLEAVAARLVERYRASGMDRDQMLEVVDAIREDPDNARLAQLLRTAIGGADEEAGATPQGEAPSFAERLSAYASAVAAGDSAATDSLRPPVARIVAAPELAERDRRIASLGSENAGLQEEVRDARSDLETEREKGLRRTVTNLLDEFGLGLGWSGLYFTFLTGFFRGRTPGKRLLGIRIVRLDGKPLGYWASFERFGGYAASLFTGFEGFLRILWDPNRQGLEDKLAETVVVVDSAETRGQLERVAMWGPTGAPPQG